LSNYVKTTDFAAKDALPTGNPGKLASGTQVDDEFDAIAIAIATKEDTANKDAANGYAGLDSNSRITESKLPALDGDVTTTAGDATTTIANNAVTNAKAADMAAATVKGRAVGAGTGDPTDLTAAQLVAIIVTADGAGSGLDADTLDGSNSSAFASASHNHSATELTSGSIPDARVPLSNVSQHQASIQTRNITGKSGTAKTLSTSAASGGSDGDIWYRY
jgi:hypothetical protein